MARRTKPVEAAGVVPGVPTGAPGALEKAGAGRSQAVTDKTVTLPVALKESEKSMVEDIALELGISRNSLCRYALAYMVQQYRRGKLDLKASIRVRRINELPMP